MEAPMAVALAARGYVAVTIEYRLSGEAKYPAALDDLREGLLWMLRKGRDAGIDTAKIAVLGPSAGGTLALLLGTTGACSCLKAMVSIDGVADLTDPAESGKDTVGAEPSAGARWIGFTYAQRPDLWREASPVCHAGPDSPPVLFINSSIPRFHAGRDSMIARLSVSGIRAVVRAFPKAPHTFWLFHPWFNQATRWAIEFLDKTLRNPSNEHR
jgi:pectinesterase